jgi:glycosyltransferase involved in cell wall biosynthesis
MQVMLYLKHFPPTGSPLVGGTSVAVDGLATGLSQNGVEVTVLCEGAARSTVGTERRYTIECFPNPHRYRTFSLSPELKCYAVQRMTAKRGICVINGMFHPGACAMGRLMREHRIPYVVMPHGAYDHAMFRKNAHLKWPYWYLFERTLLRKARAIQTLDTSQAACLRRLGIKADVIEAPNGVAMESVPELSRLRWAAPGEPGKFMFFGRVDPYIKGLDIFLEAFTRILPKMDARLTIQGPGNRASLEKRAAAWGVSQRVVFRNADYKQPVSRILGACDVLCLPSRSEGFGLAALEAMTAGRVLLVSERAGIASHVRASDCGVVVRPSVTGIEAGLLNVMRRRRKWREMGLRGRQYALDNLQWKRIAADVLKNYERLMG